MSTRKKIGQTGPHTVQGTGTADDSALQSYKRCIIYTRKSSEEGLEQDFNSLHAQREACEAYIQSQRHEGWRLLRDRDHHYDDGGLSGGNMERPGLLRMLAAIEDGQIDVIVVYKVDRLTRSLADFARIVDVMDRHGVSFVSITQALNTTSSMGRLTLNVLLSFAQFEREVTAERIRDKIAASKKKGIWMGGPVPLGYRAQNKRLVIDEAEAKIVRRVFETYLRTSSVVKTKAELDEAGITTRKRSRKNAGPMGGHSFSPAGICALLRNPVYIGKIRHKDEVYEGGQGGIVEESQFKAAQRQLDSATGGNRKRRGRAGSNGMAQEPIAGRLLTGRLFDVDGHVMSPTHTNKKGVRYRYYLSTAPLSSAGKESGGSSDRSLAKGPRRISANKLERALLVALRSPLTANLSDVQLLESVERIEVTAAGATLTFIEGCEHENAEQAEDGTGLQSTGVQPSERGTERQEEDLRLHSQPTPPSRRLLHVPIDWQRRVHRDVRSPAASAGEIKAQKSADRQRRANDRLLQAIATAHRHYQIILHGDVRTISELASRERCSVRGLRLGLNLAWLAPDIVQAVIQGKLDASISATELARSMPSDWQAQRHLVGLST
ncbi:recombinase family protein [Pseudahrensia aquimaris]|uniref:Recombinase family protein n=1 Tax=Pseudahrensia aquimaris TaxID=744461 RepID=A0ABW3FL25_9HYPH